MKFKGFIVVVFLLFIFSAQAVQPEQILGDENISKSEIINVDSLLQVTLSDTISIPKTLAIPSNSGSTQLIQNQKAQSVEKPDTVVAKAQSNDTVVLTILSSSVKVQKVDSLLLSANPLLIDLVYTGLPINLKTDSLSDLKTLYYGKKAKTLSTGAQRNFKNQSADKIITNLRSDTRDKITQNAVNLYVMNFENLPDPDENKSHFIVEKPLRYVKFSNDNSFANRYHRRLVIKNPQLGPWQYKATSMAQFSESVISPNWYQGGNSNLAVLGILTGQLTYDDKKSIQWDNNAEWHLGFNSVAGDTLHWLNTNDDVLKINSKLGIKATGNFFYSGSVDFSTQFFNSYNGINSTALKASFLTPVRLNIGVGLDYKYKKIFSLMLSPFSYKYIYVNDNLNVDPNLFGVKTGKKVLSEVGSSFKAIYSYPVSHEIQLDSQLSFYTNYQKVEIDWEVVCNMTINRFLSTRISFNPRYDNTVIEKDGALARMQLKQLLSVGFAHKFD